MPSIKAGAVLTALSLSLLMADRLTADEPTPWAGRLELGDAPVEITLLVPAEPDEDTGVEAFLEGVGGLRRDLAIEEWRFEGSESQGAVVSFRLVGLERPYRFAGTRRGDQITGTLRREPPPVPTTDLYLVSLQTGSDGWILSAPRNLTEREGYDNQPYFLPDSQSLLYTSMREEQTDVYRFDLPTRVTTRITATRESEYSPTPLPVGPGFSTVRVEADGTQRLWAFDPDGSRPRLVLESIAPVGYHAWLDDHTLALFVLADPPTLQVADLGTGRAVVRDEGIGRALHRTPLERALTYVRKEDGGHWTIRRIDLETGDSEVLIETLPGSEDFIWTGSNELLMGSGSKLFLARPDEHGWREIADFSAWDVSGITRLALSPDGRSLVLVAARPDLSPFPEAVSLTLTRRDRDS